MIMEFLAFDGAKHGINPVLVAHIREMPRDCIEYQQGARTEIRTAGGCQCFVKESIEVVCARIDRNCNDWNKVS